MTQVPRGDDPPNPAGLAPDGKNRHRIGRKPSLSRGDDPPNPPIRDRPGLIARTAVVSGLPGRARAATGSHSRTETTRRETVTAAGRKLPRLSRRAPGRQGARRKRHSVLMNALMTVMLVYALLPLFWLVVNASKTQRALFTTFGLWFGGRFALWSNIHQVVTYDNGIFLRWLANTLLYVVVGAGGATLLATLAGYGMAKYDFPGKRLVFAVVLGAVAVPGTALAVPTFLLFSNLHLANTPWSVILPSLVSPLGLYLIWVYASDAVPTELLEAARIDGAGEFRTFFVISSRLLMPGVVTVALFTVVATWNNYFLPLIMLSNPSWYPLTVGLNDWNQQSFSAGGQAIYNLVITGSLLTVIPIMVAFLIMQRYWRSGLAAGAVKQ
jgi:multiple sugar transport system permease protein